MEVFRCRDTDCCKRFFSVRALTSHMSLMHGNIWSSDFVCGVGDCSNIYHTVGAYRKHLCRKHHDLWTTVTVRHKAKDLHSVCSPDESYGSCDVDDDLLSHMDVSGEPESTIVELKQELGESIAIKRMKISELHMLPKTVSSAIFSDVENLMDTCQFGLQNIVRNRLFALGIDYQSDHVLDEALRDVSLFESVSASFSSDHLFLKHCRESLGLVEPCPVYVNSDIAVGKVLVGHYVPILSTIAKYLSHSDVWSCYQKEYTCTGNLLRDYTDGLIWKSHSLPHKYLRLHLYTDEFEVCNPIGSRKGVHKISAFYYTLGNINAKHRSKLCNIHLALLLKYNCVRKYGYNAVIQPMIDDLVTLESCGVDVMVEDKCVNVRGSVVTVSGDNLSAHALGGFNPTFSSGRICRHCFVSYSRICEVFSEESCSIRTKEIHEQHVQSVANHVALKPVYGVYGDCPLSTLQYFDPVNCMPPDIMHDVLEGVMSLSVQLVVKKMVLQRFFNMKTVTDCMHSFCYGHPDKGNKPEPLPYDFVNKNKSVSGTAAEKWCLFRLLPLLIGHLIPPDHDVWRLFLMCRQICDYILSPVVKVDELPFVELLIAHHHQLLAEIAPNYFVPKMHYLVHYPRMMLLFGPLRLLWSMRYEAKHQFFKQMARRSRNYRNITYSLAERHQKRSCCEQSDQECLGKSVVFSEHQTPLRITMLPQSLQNVLVSKFGLSYDTQCTAYRWLSVDGNKMFVNGLLTVQVSDEGFPVFLRISHVLHFMGQWIICGTLTSCAKFLRHYHAYALCSSAEWLAVAVSEVVPQHPIITSYKVEDDDVAVLHHCV